MKFVKDASCSDLGVEGKRKIARNSPWHPLNPIFEAGNALRKKGTPEALHRIASTLGTEAYCVGRQIPKVARKR